MQNKEVGIGILGLGNVGRGVLSTLKNNKDFIEQELSPSKVKVVGLADLDEGRKPGSSFDYQFFTRDAQEVITHPDIQIVVEAIGGEYPAYNLIKQAFEAGKHVVTPNKEVVAKHGYELIRIAHQHNVQFLFETSVVSAIPILGTMVNMITSAPLDEISGILNGTTNYVLELMLEQDKPQAEAVKKAQEMGYAEADPEKDINGWDALYKIFILATLGFRGKLDLNQIEPTGISKITLADLKLAKEMGYSIKLVATARKVANNKKLNVGVRPVLVPDNHLLSHIHGAHNGIFLSGNGYGELFFSGAGAGGLAGASMIISDIIRIIREPAKFDFNFLLRDAKEWEIERAEQAGQAGKHYFIRIEIEDKQENSENISHILSEQGLPVERAAELRQKDKENILNIGLIADLKKESEIKEIIRKIKEIAHTHIRAIEYLEVYQNKE